MHVNFYVVYDLLNYVYILYHCDKRNFKIFSIFFYLNSTYSNSSSRTSSRDPLTVKPYTGNKTKDADSDSW